MPTTLEQEQQASEVIEIPSLDDLAVLTERERELIKANPTHYAHGPHNLGHAAALYPVQATTVVVDGNEIPGVAGILVAHTDSELYVPEGIPQVIPAVRDTKGGYVFGPFPTNTDVEVVGERQLSASERAFAAELEGTYDPTSVQLFSREDMTRPMEEFGNVVEFIVQAQEGSKIYVAKLNLKQA
tara:strand:+ start:1304 stop:1858 length:555 start_codon:yes stop_codon:yes gene_type:complete